MNRLKDKINMVNDCKNGKHVFIPANWKISPSSKVCTLFICERCLMGIDKAEVEIMNHEHNAELDKKAEKDAKA